MAKFSRYFEKVNWYGGGGDRFFQSQEDRRKLDELKYPQSQRSPRKVYLSDEEAPNDLHMVRIR